MYILNKDWFDKVCNQGRQEALPNAITSLKVKK